MQNFNVGSFFITFIFCLTTKSNITEIISLEEYVTKVHIHEEDKSDGKVIFIIINDKLYVMWRLSLLHILTYI